MSDEESNLETTTIDPADQTSAAGESQVEGTETQGQVEGAEASSEGAAAETPVIPGLDELRTEMTGLRDRLSGLTRGYDQIMSAKQQTDATNRQLMDQLAQIRSTMNLADEDKSRKQLAELVEPSLVEPLLGIIRSEAQRQAQQTVMPMVDKRFLTYEQQQQQRVFAQHVEAANTRVNEYATKRLGLNEAQLEAFYQTNVGSDGQPFSWCRSPQDFERQAILMLNGQYAERVAKVGNEVAAKAGERAALARLKTAGTGQSTSVRTGAKEMTPTEETMAMLRSVED